MSVAMTMDGDREFGALLERVLGERREEAMAPAGLEQRLMARLAQEAPAPVQRFAFAESVKARRSTASIWTAVVAHAVVLIAVFALAARHQLMSKQVAIVPLNELVPPSPLPLSARQIGGGGGTHDVAPVSRGRLPELAQQQITDLSGDLITRPFVRVVPLKGARDFSEGRLVPLMMRSAQALTDYLRVRRSHRQSRLPALWLGSRNRGPMTGSGVYQMLDRRAEEAGYDPQAVHPHMFRHTVANDWLAGGGSEGDLMRLMGWNDRSMVRSQSGPMAPRRPHPPSTVNALPVI